jgi:KUP system potassium uptake protein
MQKEAGPDKSPRGKYLLLSSLASLGIVYGDIGTSPLYAIRECFHGSHAIAVTPANVFGVLSLVFWSLVIVISVKYLVFVLRADNRGEGGILALTALATPLRASSLAVRRRTLILLGLFGAALLYGDGMITPAISVLSAVEGLKVATPVLDHYVVPLAIAILVGLFMIQRHGTAGVGSVFGPITLVWFLCLAALGVAHIAKFPTVLNAVNPVHCIGFVVANPVVAFWVLGAVFLVITGGEALYADVGHFGKLPIRLTWFLVVLPSLLLNYFGQGALLLVTPGAAVNPFYQMAPRWALYPLVVLATMATVIASQAVISGSFSLTRQAVQLGFCPRLSIDHTSAEEIGQIYVSIVNWGLMLASVGLVLGFRSSSNLAAAYGMAVATTMVITTLLFYVVARRRWKFSLPAAISVCGLFLAIDLCFLAANVLKIAHGGWFPLVVASVVFTLMTTWKSGRRILAERLREGAVRLEDFLESDEVRHANRVPGIVIFMYSNAAWTPPALLNNFRYNGVLHEHCVILNVETEEVPHVSSKERVDAESLGNGFYRVVVRYGFMEDPDIPAILKRVNLQGLHLDPDKVIYFLGRERLLATEKPGMAIWREKLFAVMSRNALGATTFYHIPPYRVVELGQQIEL